MRPRETRRDGVGAAFQFVARQGILPPAAVHLADELGKVAGPPGWRVLADFAKVVRATGQECFVGIR